MAVIRPKESLLGIEDNDRSSAKAEAGLKSNFSRVAAVG